MGKFGYFVTPNGDRIIGTLETVEARANFEDFGSIELHDDGSVELYYDGSDIFYDSMRTQEDRQGRMLYLDEHGATWTQDQLTFVEN
ncbi:hypothetical protein [Dokdonella sp.]|uniref:hypothetical protein n=1 Tax=Dokdonella sp. TaxID=2291710 RepID=UPI0031C95136|nr:hypothetical protein [Dokdonella sp.]